MEHKNELREKLIKEFFLHQMTESLDLFTEDHVLLRRADTAMHNAKLLTDFFLKNIEK
jgi:hypothetical protein